MGGFSHQLCDSLPEGTANVETLATIQTFGLSYTRRPHQREQSWAIFDKP